MSELCNITKIEWNNIKEEEKKNTFGIELHYHIHYLFMHTCGGLSLWHIRSDTNIQQETSLFGYHCTPPTAYACASTTTITPVAH